MDDWDLDYYTDLFQNKIRRNPTSVECFDLAQSNRYPDTTIVSVRQVPRYHYSPSHCRYCSLSIIGFMVT